MLLSKSSPRATVLTTFAMISLCASAQRPGPGPWRRAGRALAGRHYNAIGVDAEMP